MCGLRVRSGLVLPELPSWPGPEAGAPDVVVDEGHVPERLDGAAQGNDYVTVSADGAVLLNVPGLVRILARGGRKIIVDILRRDDPAAAWRLFLLGSGLGYLCHQRGLFPLHAASLDIGGRAAAIAGPSGAGKSTLSLALTACGHALLSDDVTVLRTETGAGPQISPPFRA